MNPVTEINEGIDVIATFKNKDGKVVVMPSVMRWRGRNVKLTTLGLYHPMRRGARLYYVFDMSDGANDYSLEFDTVELTWRLISLIDGSSL